MNSPIRVGDPISHASVSVFPLFAQPDKRVEYQLSFEAIEVGTVVVTEVSDEGSVPEVAVENKGDIRWRWTGLPSTAGCSRRRIACVERRFGGNTVLLRQTDSRRATACEEAEGRSRT